MESVRVLPSTVTAIEGTPASMNCGMMRSSSSSSLWFAAFNSASRSRLRFSRDTNSLSCSMFMSGLTSWLVRDFGEDRLHDFRALLQSAHDPGIHGVPRDKVDVFNWARLAGAVDAGERLIVLAQRKRQRVVHRKARAGEIDSNAACTDLRRENLALAILPAFQFIAASGQFEAGALALFASLVDGIQVGVKAAEDHHRLLAADIFQGVGEELLLRVVDAVHHAIVGRDTAPGDLLEPQELYHCVRSRHGAVVYAGHQVLVFVPVDPRSFRSQVAMIGNVGFRRQVQHFLPHPERDPARSEERRV